ncbi:MAG: rhodanese-related sulfurtransferase [Flavobacterium sp.]|jgi:rhodanese-related sulfurtransferase
MIKNFIVYFIFLISFVRVSQNTNTYKNLSVNDFQTKIFKEKKVQLLDVRTIEELESGIIKNSKNINWFDANFDKQATVLDKNKAVYVYCKAGGRSSKACAKLAELGFTKIYNLDGGMDSWKIAKKEITYKN